MQCKKGHDAADMVPDGDGDYRCPVCSRKVEARDFDEVLSRWDLLAVVAGFGVAAFLLFSYDIIVKDRGLGLSIGLGVSIAAIGAFVAYMFVMVKRKR